MTVSATTPIDATKGTTTTAATDSTAAGRTRLADNMNMFLTLLTTQMKNQDPTSPMDSNQFMTQLVQMTGVEQQLAGNDLLKQLVANTGTNLSSAVGLIGKDVRATTTDATLSKGQAKWGYTLSADATDVKIQVLDSKGVPVRTLAGSADDMKAGDHSFTWDGKDDSGLAQPDGAYTLKITPLDSTGQSIPSSTFIEGIVTGLEQDSTGAVITVNGGKVALSSVTSVTEPTTTTTTTTNTSTGDQTSS